MSRVEDLKNKRKQRQQSSGKVAASTAPTAATAAKTVTAAGGKKKGVEMLPQTNNGIGHDVLAPAKDMGEPRSQPEWGFSVPQEIADVVKEAADAPWPPKGDSEGTMGEIIPPALADKVMSVYDPRVLEAQTGVEFDMIFFGQDRGSPTEIMSAGAHWMLVANGKPLAEVNIANQGQDAAVIAGHFVTQDYARMFLDSIKTNGLGKTLQASKATPYVAVVNKNGALAETRQQLQASFDQTLRSARADQKARLLNTTNLVIEGQVNNFYPHNPMKDEFIRLVASVGVSKEQASLLADEMFWNAGTKQIDATLNKAEELASLTPEALNEVASAIRNSGRRARPVNDNPNFDGGLARSLAAAAVPVSHTPDMSKTVDPQHSSYEESNNSMSASAIAARASVGGDRKQEFRSKYGGFRKS